MANALITGLFFQEDKISFVAEINIIFESEQNKAETKCGSGAYTLQYPPPPPEMTHVSSPKGYFQFVRLLPNSKQTGVSVYQKTNVFRLKNIFQIKNF